jgi:hypothetical protein
MINFSLLARIFASANRASARATATALLCRRNLEGRFVLYLERHRARDKAFLGGSTVQAARDVLVRSSRELGVGPQRDAFELASTVRPLDLHAGGVVAVCYDHDTGVSAKVQVPELMTGGKRGDEQLCRIPSRCIASEHWVGRASYGRFALRADLVRTRIGAVRRRADPLIAGPVDANRIGVTLVCHGLMVTFASARLSVSLAMLPEIMALVVAVAAVVVAAAAV